MCREIVAHDPDLVLLTGDYYTGEANKDGLLQEGLSPLEEISSRCYACLGNHDMESMEVIKRCERELQAVGIRLLRDESCVHTLKDKKIHIIGFDYVSFKNPERGQRILKLLEKNPLPSDCYPKRIGFVFAISSFFLLLLSH
ncbi:putative phosphodiesterase [Reticulomyxa filosa]|uniref:Putative phosphodiesterase n=1 Tax=Reticulomyxa filosa TaxID=46433 RepID=X6NNU1_RETFI|nr:putative phosphodiesterase [Reticulomyxa filosa]|eukprot:ETO27603.1 putative phosphodiesterase [Reticulomyxa filosa]